MHLASILQQAGARPWITLSCRDRNRVVLEQELRGLRELGVDAVLCVTGDARAYNVRPDDTRSSTWTGRGWPRWPPRPGCRPAVPETPAAPPRHLRPFRLAQKQRAGAAVAVLNHDTVALVAGFMAAAARAGVTIPVIAAVAIFTDPASASALSGLPGLELDPAVVRAVLDDPDPIAAGIAAAARQAGALLAIPGVAGVNISGRASARGHEFAARIKAELAAGSGSGPHMTRNIDDPMEAEFDTVAEWVAQVAADLGPEYYIPAARVITAQAGAEGFDGAIRLAEQQLPAARQMPGFKGYYLLTDAETGKLVIISLWETREQMERSHSRGRRRPGIRDQGLPATGLTALHLETYQVTMHA